MKSNEAKPSIRLVAAAIVLCVSSLAMAAAPQVIVVEVTVPGGRPERIESEVVLPLERALAKLPLVRRVSASIRDGFCEVEVSYETSPTPGAVAQVQAAVAVARKQFPSEAAKPIVSLKQPRIP